jgi:periplasmic protein TonB
MAATIDIFEEREDWHKPIGWSVAFHAVLFGSMLLYAAWRGDWQGSDWGGSGGGGGAISVNLTSAIPLPVTTTQQQPNVLATESKGLSKSLPKQEAKPEPEALAIPERESKTKKKTTLTAKNTRPEPPQPPTNVVPYGEGGPANSVPFRMAGGSGGIGINAPGGGDFGTRYSWYVDKVRRIISENWFKYEVGPNAASGARVYLTFQITRDGRPTNVQIEQSSRIPSLDYSAVNALRRIDSFGPLPPDYRGSSVAVEFYFDLNR